LHSTDQSISESCQVKWKSRAFGPGLDHPPWHVSRSSPDDNDDDYLDALHADLGLNDTGWEGLKDLRAVLGLHDNGTADPTTPDPLNRRHTPNAARKRAPCAKA
jgi:hypothetical protein